MGNPKVIDQDPERIDYRHFTGLLGWLRGRNFFSALNCSLARTGTFRLGTVSFFVGRYDVY